MNTKWIREDVAVIGAGLAGMAASIHLAKAGMRVLCIEAESTHGDAVGESLDWSAPSLLKDLGLPMELLIDQGIATYKRHVTLKLEDGSEQHYIPAEWLARAPFDVDLRTLHVDRVALGRSLREIADGHGIKIAADKVIATERDGRRVRSITTASGLRITCPWFIDASGAAARLFPRAFQLPSYEYGPTKVAVWEYFKAPGLVEGTTLYATGSPLSYLEWVWQIPVRPDTVSIGYVAPGDAIKAQRQLGVAVEEIYESQLNRFSSLQKLLQDAGPIEPRVTSFRCRVHGRVAGPNWFVVGEAAAMVDPMTSNGVTSALRHAAEAAKLIIRSRRRSRLPYLSTAMYSWRVRQMAKFFNVGIERIMYQRPVRERFGLHTAGDVYTVPAWLMNLLYTRTRPTGPVSTAVFGLLLACLRGAASLLSWLCTPPFSSSTTAAS